jgi:hypothetical protein
MVTLATQRYLAVMLCQVFGKPQSICLGGELLEVLVTHCASGRNTGLQWVASGLPTVDNHSSSRRIWNQLSQP